MSPELVADITEYALNKPGFVCVAMDMPCAQLVTVLQLMSGSHQRKVPSEGSLTGALDSQTMLNKFLFFFFFFVLMIYNCNSISDLSSTVSPS